MAAVGRKPPLGTLRGKAHPERREAAMIGRLEHGRITHLNVCFFGSILPLIRFLERCFVQMVGVASREGQGNTSTQLHAPSMEAVP